MAASFTFNHAHTDVPLRCPRCGIFANADVKLEAMASYHAMGIVRACPKCFTAYICHQHENKRSPSSLPTMMYTITPLLIICEQCNAAVRIRFVDPELEDCKVLVWYECIAEGTKHQGSQHQLATISSQQLAHARAGGHALVTNTIRVFSDEEADRAAQESERQSEKWMHISKLLERFGKQKPPVAGETF